MPKQPTLPKLYDELKTISISLLKRYRYLKPNQQQGGIVTWSTELGVTGSISISVNMHPGAEYLELKYSYNDKPINYRVLLTSIRSNLGRGNLWYFVCPKTGKRCRKLYLADTYFYHRSSLKCCMYEKQTKSKKERYIDKILSGYFQTDKLFEQLYKKHFKKKYAGKPTKKYLKLTQKIQRAETTPYYEIERALLG